MVIARSTRENIPYIIESERDLKPEEQTVFKIAVLPNHIMLVLMEYQQAGKQKQLVELALTAGLRGWDNFPDEGGAETPFAREEGRSRLVHGVKVKDPVKVETLEVIPGSLLVELTNAVIGANQIALDEAKN